MEQIKKKRVQPSGASNRKKRKEKDMKERFQSGDFMPGSSSMSLYGAAQQWDPNDIAYQLPIYGVPPPTTVRVISGFINQLEQGAFYLCATLLDGMLRDDRISACLQVRLDGFIASKMDMKPGEDDEQGHKIKEDAEKLLSRMVPPMQLKELLRWGLFMSVGIAQITETRTANSTIPTFTVWNPKYLRFDWLLRRYRLVTENLGEITLEFANGENYLDGAISLRENGEEEKWIVYEPYGSWGWLHGALIRPLVLPWLIRYQTRTWWARHQEIHGQPLRLGIVPAERQPSAEKSFLSQLANIGSESVIRLTQGLEGNKFDVKLLESAADNWEGFKQLLEHCDDSIAIIILGQSQSTKGQGGLGTQEKAGESTLLKLHRMDSLIGSVIRDQLLKSWCADNYGENVECPELVWDIEPPEDLQAKSTQLLNLAKAVQTFALAPGFARHVDIRALLESFDIPLVEEDQVPIDLPGEPNGGLKTAEEDDKEQEMNTTETQSQQDPKPKTKPSE